jgi:hypothetical protein
LGVVNLGIMAGQSPEQIFQDLRAAVPRGKRPVRDGGIWDAINKALSEHGDGFIPKPKPKPLVHDGRAVLQKLIQQGRGITEADILEVSPVPIPARPEEHGVVALQTLYAEASRLFIGERYGDGIIGKTIRTRAGWAEYFRTGGPTAPHIIVNPLDGKPHPTKSDPEKMTYRGDACVADFRFTVVEFDDLGRDEQLAFWSVINLPVCALIDSAGKSIHAWLSVRKLAAVRTLEDWDAHVRDRLYKQTLVPLGCDPACSNPARLSRLPGHFRSEKGRWQRLLYLAPEGRKVF